MRLALVTSEFITSLCEGFSKQDTKLIRTTTTLLKGRAGNLSGESIVERITTKGKHKQSQGTIRNLERTSVYKHKTTHWDNGVTPPCDLKIE